MMIRFLAVLYFILLVYWPSVAQCTNPVNTFPYQESFETSDGGWFAGGTGSDWVWGIPSKPVISSAGEGARCWVVGGITGSAYNNSEASWLQSPCFDLSSLQYPLIDFLVFWETEQQFDGASLQFSVDNGNTWSTLGSFNDASNCLNENWYNQSPVTYLSPLTANREGWSGNIQPSSGSCRGGRGSNGWVRAKHLMPSLAGRSSVIFRFIFGAGSICNDYDGFAIDAISLSEAPANSAGFTHDCSGNKTVLFTNTSSLCPTVFNWDFGDPASGSANTSAQQHPEHRFSEGGTYTVTLTVSGPGNAPSTITKDITVLAATPIVVNPADCLTGDGGSATVIVTGGNSIYTYLWNTTPPQSTAQANNLSAANYSVSVSSPGTCQADTSITIPLDPSCLGIYFPNAFTPNNDGKNDTFGPLGSLAAITHYRLTIYNRWGQVVFRSTNPFEKWHGRIKGKQADSGLFVWHAEFSVSAEPRESRKGTIMLIR